MKNTHFNHIDHWYLRYHNAEDVPVPYRWTIPSEWATGAATLSDLSYFVLVFINLTTKLGKGCMVYYKSYDK